MASRTNVNANKCAGSGGDECEKEEMVEVHVFSWSVIPCGYIYIYTLWIRPTKVFFFFSFQPNFWSSEIEKKILKI